MFKLRIVMKPDMGNDSFTVLGEDGRTYVMFFRVEFLLWDTGWKRVPFVQSFPS